MTVAFVGETEFGVGPHTPDASAWARGAAPADIGPMVPVKTPCVSPTSILAFPFESTQKFVADPACRIWQLTGVFRRMASNRVSFSRFAAFEAASLNWYVR